MISNVYHRNSGANNICDLYNVTQASLQLNLGQAAQAERLCRRALDIRTRLLGASHFETGLAMAALCDALCALERWAALPSALQVIIGLLNLTGSPCVYKQVHRECGRGQFAFANILEQRQSHQSGVMIAGLS